MPHLSPLNWIMMPLIILMVIYTQMMYLHFTQPTSFPRIKLTPTTLPQWQW